VLASPLVTLIVERYPIVVMWDFDWRCVECGCVEVAHKIARAPSEVETDFGERDQLPPFRECSVESAECVGDPTPLLDRGITRVATVDHVPHEASDYANSFSHPKI
jgi:hypothetical protein